MSKKRYQVIRRKPNVDNVRGLKFGRSNAFTVSDKGLAREIEKDFGIGRGGTGDVLVYEDDRTDRRLSGEDGVHHYTFTIPAKTWRSDPDDDPWIRVGNKLVHRRAKG